MAAPIGAKYVQLVDENAGDFPSLTVTRCKFHIEKKRRNCSLRANEKSSYCGEHQSAADDELPSAERILCPIDPRHSCWKRNLEKHLNKCRKVAEQKEENVPVFYDKNVNSDVDVDNAKDDLIQATANTAPREEVVALIEKVRSLYTKYCPPVTEQILFHDVFSDIANDPQNGEKALKHIKQEASIIGHMREGNLLADDEAVFVEFGAGRGQLSYWLGKVVGERSRFVAVDRSNIRNKFDRRQDCEHRERVNRIKIDIEHLNLGKVPDIENCTWPVIGYSKHLCGPATDLCLRCVVNTLTPDVKSTDDFPPKNSRLKGLVVALCCHHKGTWRHYTGKTFFLNHGLAARDYHIIQSLTSWATCGFIQKDCVDGKSLDDVVLSSSSNVTSATAEGGEWSPSARAAIGQQCKRLIDAGRIKYMEDNGYNTQLVRYVHTSVTLENILMILTPKR